MSALACEMLYCIKQAFSEPGMCAAALLPEGIPERASVCSATFLLVLELNGVECLNSGRFSFYCARQL